MPISFASFLVATASPMPFLLLTRASPTTIKSAGAVAFFTAILVLAQTVALPAFGVSAAWAGFQLLFSTSTRNQEAVKEQLKWSVIGLVVILAATQLAELIKQAASVTGSGS
jgi:hypothetical protein